MIGNILVWCIFNKAHNLRIITLVDCAMNYRSQSMFPWHYLETFVPVSRPECCCYHNILYFRSAECICINPMLKWHWEKGRPIVLCAKKNTYHEIFNWVCLSIVSRNVNIIDSQLVSLHIYQCVCVYGCCHVMCCFVLCISGLLCHHCVSILVPKILLSMILLLFLH